MYNATLSSQQQNALMHNILERITDGFFAVDKDWRVLLWNKEAENIIQKKKQDVLGKNVWECFPEAVRLKYYTYYQQAITTQLPVYFEEVYPPLNIRTQVSAYPSESGLSVYFKKAEEAKTEEIEQSLLSLIARETINAVTLLNADGTISWINDAFTKITGFRYDESVGKKTSELILGPETDLLVVDTMREAFFNHLPFQGELLVYTKNKEQKWLSIAAQPLPDVSTKTNKYFLMQTDITEQKKMIRQLKENQKQTTAAIILAQEREREWIGQELHDNVNQLLATIKLFIEISRSHPEKSDELLPRCTELIKDAVQETRNISHRLTPPQFEEGTLEDSIHTLAGTIRDTSQFALRLNLSGITGVKAGKETRLAVYRILQEHLMNIIKHAQATEVEIMANKMDDALVFKVVDNGKGFDLNEKRSGIGLINMKNRAESVDGSLVINSKAGLGCVLIVSIPITGH